MKVYLMLDVGGTNIKAGVLAEDGSLWKDGILSFDAKSRGSREEIFQNFASVLAALTERLPKENLQIEGIGMAFPGPFDYEQGISLMQGLDKYDAIYGIPIEKELRNCFLSMKNGCLLRESRRFVFLHDVEAFAMGESHYGRGRDCEKVMYLCIGTGAGSAFTRDRKILKGEDGSVPPRGWIFDTPFRGSIIDDYLSVRGLASLSGQAFKEAKDGKELFRLCQEGDQVALAVYREFGRWLKEAISPFLAAFCPDGFVLGGQISKSFPFYGEAFAAECRERGTTIFLSEDTSESALKGLYVRMETETSLSL